MHHSPPQHALTAMDPGNWSLAQCIGQVAFRHTTAMQQKQAVRHPGGNRGYDWCTTCLGAAAAQVASGGHEIGLKLDPRAGSYRPGARVYLSDECAEGVFNPGHFSNLQLLGRTLAVTIDLSAADCNCMVQWYLVPLRRSTNSNACGGDYYCDATEQCGGQCDEIDLLEANQHALHSAIHHTGEAAHGSADAGEEGLYNGYGGGRRQIPQGQYGPAGGTIDTRLPFRVHAFFGTDRRSGHLTGIEVTLQQGDRSLHYPIVSKWRDVDGLTATFEAGLTPVMSYSSAQDISWLDRPPCPEFTRNDVQAQDRCGEAASFSDFAVCEGNVWCEGDFPPPPPPPSPAPSPPPPSPPPPGAPPSPPSTPPPSPPPPPAQPPPPAPPSEPSAAVLHQLELATDQAARDRVGAWAVAVLVTTLVFAGLKLALGPVLWRRGCQPRIGASLLGISEATVADAQMSQQQRPQESGGEARIDSADPRWSENGGGGGVAIVAGVTSGTRDAHDQELDWD